MPRAETLVAMLSGELTIEQRAAVINRFRAGNEKILITTNVSARGIDVAQVTVVINFDLPIVHETKEPDFETYLHRIGRTGRFGKKGLAINMVDSPKSRDDLQKIRQHFGKPIEKLDADDVDELERLEQR
jgi:ATP-dependent RNA helicase DDX19/DBP5